MPSLALPRVAKSGKKVRLLCCAALRRLSCYFSRVYLRRAQNAPQRTPVARRRRRSRFGPLRGGILIVVSGLFGESSPTVSESRAVVLLPPFSSAMDMYALAGLRGDGATSSAAAKAPAPAAASAKAESSSGSSSGSGKAAPSPWSQAGMGLAASAKLLPPKVKKAAQAKPKSTAPAAAPSSAATSLSASIINSGSGSGGSSALLGTNAWYNNIKDAYDPAHPNDFDEWQRETQAAQKAKELEEALAAKQAEASKKLEALQAASPTMQPAATPLAAPPSLASLPPPPAAAAAAAACIVGGHGRRCPAARAWPRPRNGPARVDGRGEREAAAPCGRGQRHLAACIADHSARLSAAAASVSARRPA